MRAFLNLASIVLIVCLFGLSCSSEKKEEWNVVASNNTIEVNKTIALSAMITTLDGAIPSFEWKASSGIIQETACMGEVNYKAPNEAGIVNVMVTCVAGSKTFEKTIKLEILPQGSLKKNAMITIEVDTNTLKSVWVDASHPKESFKGPLLIKGTFGFDEASGEATVGGNWRNYSMRDDGQKGDKVAKDNIWTIVLNFEKSDAKINFAFDDANQYRVQYESGLTFRLKSAWIELDEVKDDHSNPAFIVNNDKTIAWTKALAQEAKINQAP